MGYREGKSSRKVEEMTDWWVTSLIAGFMGPTWGPPGAEITQVSPMVAPCTLSSELISFYDEYSLHQINDLPIWFVCLRLNMYADSVVFTGTFSADSYWAYSCYFMLNKCFSYYYNSYRRALLYKVRCSVIDIFKPSFKYLIEVCYSKPVGSVGIVNRSEKMFV